MEKSIGNKLALLYNKYHDGSHRTALAWKSVLKSKQMDISTVTFIICYLLKRDIRLCAKVICPEFCNYNYIVVNYCISNMHFIDSNDLIFAMLKIGELDYLNKIFDDSNNSINEELFIELLNEGDYESIITLTTILVKHNRNISGYLDYFYQISLRSDKYKKEEDKLIKSMWDYGCFNDLFEYCSIRSDFNRLLEVLCSDKEKITKELFQYEIGKSYKLLLHFSSTNQLLSLFNHLKQSNSMSEQFVFANLAICLYPKYIKFQELQIALDSINIDKDYLFENRRYLGKNLIDKYEFLLSYGNDAKELMAFLEVTEKINVFKIHVSKKNDKQKKYRNRNEEFYNKVVSLNIDNKKKNYILNNTHLKMFRYTKEDII